MALELYNSLTKKQEVFQPLKTGEVKMYVCGVTPYDTGHVGHMFTYTQFDVLYRYLSYKGNKVKYVQNVTDIDDDILRKAAETGENWMDLGKRYTESFLQDMESLNCIKPDPYVKATDSIPGVIQMVNNLMTHGFAYERNGTVYYEVAKFPEYGKLSGYSYDKMKELSAERGADPDDPNKKDPLDFIMWQAAKPGEPTWDSPWGAGRPGWHIECSAMSEEHLGPQIDIHGGGDDLIYPHHESEIAQSESFTDKKPFAGTFIHTGGVSYNGEKMSKSLGNLVLVGNLKKDYDTNVIKLMILSHHWPVPWEFRMEEMEQAAGRWEELVKVKSEKGEGKSELDAEFVAIMDDNLNTEEAIKLLEEKRPENISAHLQLLGFKL